MSKHIFLTAIHDCGYWQPKTHKHTFDFAYDCFLYGAVVHWLDLDGRKYERVSPPPAWCTCILGSKLKPLLYISVTFQYMQKECECCSIQRV